jgi:Outer membrane protein beta-barrel domain
MKKKHKKSLLLLLTSLLVINVCAQKSYMTFSAGYGMKMSTQNLPDLYMYNYTVDGDFTTREQINLSLGKGFMAEGSYGYMFGKNLGAELGISYLMGGKTESLFTYETGTNRNSVSAGMFRFNPSILISGNGGKIKPYGKLGLVAGLGTVILEENSDFTANKEIKTTKFKKGVALGVSAGLGLITRISGPVSMVCELNTVNLSYAPEMSEVTEYSQNGENKLDELTLSQKETQFYDSIKLKTIDQDQPRPALKQKLPFGSAGIKVGLQIDL